MWRGITINNSSSLTFLTCKIEDAQYAMSCDGSSSMFLSSNSFNRNYVGIRNIQATSGSSLLLFTYMANNMFTCTGLLNEPYSGQHPEPGQIGHAGILLSHAISTIGDVRFDNDFSKMEFGILASNSDIFISRCHFEGMQVTNTINSGMGLYSINGTAVVSDIFASVLNKHIGASSFTENDGGILGQGADLYINKASFKSNKNFGIQSWNNMESENVALLFNTLTMDAGDLPIGIYVERSVAASGLHNRISANKMNQVNGGISINLIGTQVAFDKALITQNTLMLDGNTDVIRGVLTAPGLTHNVNTTLNSINFIGSSIDPCPFYTSPLRYLFECRIGIHAAGWANMGGGHIIGSNTISGISGDFALVGESHKRTLYCFNSTDSTRTGLLFKGNNAPMVLESNDIYRHAYGLYINSGIIGDQRRRDNRWLPNVTDYDTYGAFNDFVHEWSRFWVQSNTPGIMPPSVNPASGWFDVENGTLSSNCPLIPTPIGNISRAEQAFLDGELATQNVDTSFIWDISFELMAKIQKDPSLISTNELIDSFYQVVYNTSTYYLAGLYNDYENAVLADTNLLNGISSASDEIVFWLDSLRILDTLYTDEGDSISIDSTYLSAFSNVSAHIIAKVHFKDSLSNKLDSLREIELNALLNTLNGLEAQGEFEENKKTLLRYKALQILDEVLQADRDSIVAIAKLCPDEFGSVVNEARTLLPICHDWHITKADGCDAFEAIQLPGQQPDYLNLEMQINPNPADDYITVQFNKQITGKLIILDMSGKRLLEQELYDVDEAVLDCTQWINGIYLVRFESNDAKVKPTIRKLVIQNN